MDQFRIPGRLSVHVAAGGGAQPELSFPAIVVAYVVRVDVKNELITGLAVAFRGRFLVFGLDRIDCVDLPKDLIQGHKTEGHAAVRAQIASEVCPSRPRMVLVVEFSSRTTQFVPQPALSFKGRSRRRHVCEPENAIVGIEPLFQRLRQVAAGAPDKAAVVGVSGRLVNPPQQKDSRPPLLDKGLYDACRQLKGSFHSIAH